MGSKFRKNWPFAIAAMVVFVISTAVFGLSDFVGLAIATLAAIVAFLTASVELVAKFAEITIQVDLLAKQSVKLLLRLKNVEAQPSVPVQPKKSLETLFEVWELFGFILSHRTREKVFEPAFNDFKADYIVTRAERFRGRFAQWWLVFCFWSRFVILILDCIRVGFQSAVLKFVFGLLGRG